MANKKTNKLMNKITQQYARDMDRALDVHEDDGFFVTALGDGTVTTAIKGKIDTVLTLMAIGIVKIVEMTATDETERDEMMDTCIDRVRGAYVASKAPRKVEA